MAKILCLVLPLPSHMHLHATLAEKLQGRGHEVMFAAMADAQPLITSYGFRCDTLFASYLPAGLMQNWLVGDVSRNSWKQKLDFYLGERRKMVDHERFVEYLIGGGYQEFVDLVSKTRPDMILVDNGLHAYWALMARQTGVPCVYTSGLLPLAEDPLTPPLASQLTPPEDWRARMRIQLAWKSFFLQRWIRRQTMRLAAIPDSLTNLRRLAKVTGCPSHAFNARTELFPALDFPTIIFCPGEFEFPSVRVRPGIHYSETLVNPTRPESSFPWERLLPEKKLIFCSLGSVAFIPPFFQAVIDAFAREPQWQLVLNIGSTLKHADFVRVPDSAILVNGAPQLSLLNRAAAMINHGGINSVRECIYFGVPQLAFPIFFDQNGAAARVKFHGLGSVGSFRMTPDEIRSVLSGLLADPGVRSRNLQMRQVFRKAERDQAAAVLVEHFLQSRR